MRRKIWVTFASACLVFVPPVGMSCRRAVTTDGRVDVEHGESTLEVDRDRYVVEDPVRGPHLTLIARFFNRTPHAVFIPRCYGVGPDFQLQVPNDTLWSHGFQPVCALVGAPPFAVQAGEARVDTIVVNDGIKPDRTRATPLETPGLYVLTYSAFTAFDQSKALYSAPLPSRWRTSRPFAVSK